MTQKAVVHLVNGGCKLCALPHDARGLAVPRQAAGHAAQPAAVVNKAFIERVGKLLPTARRWVNSAQRKIDMARDFLRRGRLDPHDPFPALHDIGKGDLALFNKYFHADKVSRAAQLEQLKWVRGIFDSMETVLTGSLLDAPMFGWGVGHFQPDPQGGTPAAATYDAFTFYGGWRQRRADGTPRLSGDDNYTGPQNLRQDTIFFDVTKLLNSTDNYILATVIHELGHFVGPGPNSGNRIADHTTHVQANFLKVNNWTAMRSASCYSYFAAESALRHITIPIP